ncbi:carbon-nitrogen hydrolase family protein [Vibrio campbellii]|uniref:carbon-nitrogen hydrolase family protein n=1 Tax=Vibrio campbellii TaxID=680 RepID=UPI001F1A20C4|nr:carbon-nitrogen hydrolase family protein [Vibrio campbellii]MCE7729838.1 carbon-nitrogen hydrolase family protein [Vibrio campbellii]
MKVGVVQMRMGWTVRENLKTIVSHVENMRALDALVFPELSLSGFHRNIKQESEPQTIRHAIQALCKLAFDYKTTLFIGAPLTEGERIFNSYLCIDVNGDVVAQWNKVGLTESETKFFARGERRELLNLAQSSITSVMCREVDDIEWFLSEVQEQANLIIWPSYIGQQSQEQQTQGYYERASLIAKEAGAFVVQCNWPHALNDPNLRGMGGSHIYDDSGQCIYTMSVDKESVCILDLNQGTIELLKAGLKSLSES